MLKPHAWTFNQLHGRILRSSITAQVEEQNYRDVLSVTALQYIKVFNNYRKSVGVVSGSTVYSVNINRWACTRNISQPIKVEKLYRDMIGTYVWSPLYGKAVAPHVTAARAHTPYRNIINHQGMTLWMFLIQIFSKKTNRRECFGDTRWSCTGFQKYNFTLRVWKCTV